MKLKLIILSIVVFFLSAGVVNFVQAEQKQVFGKYEVHYNTLTTDFLDEEVSRQYNIPRSTSLGFLLVSILVPQENGLLKGMTGNVKGNFRNLMGQKKELEFREIVEPDAVYYIATYRFNDKFNYHFDIDVQPKGDNRTFDLLFTKKLEYND